MRTVLFPVLAAAALLSSLPGCRQDSAAAPTVQPEPKIILYHLVKDFQDYPSYSVRTAPTDSPSHLATITSSWRDPVGDHIRFSIEAFFKDGEWFFDPAGSTAYVIGGPTTPSTEAGRHLPIIAAELRLSR